MREEPHIPLLEIPRSILLGSKDIGGQGRVIRADAATWLDNNLRLPEGESPESLDVHVTKFHLNPGTLLEVGLFLDEIAKATFNGFQLPMAGQEILRQLELDDTGLTMIFDAKKATRYYRQYQNYRLILYIALRLMIKNGVFVPDEQSKEKIEKMELKYSFDHYIYTDIGRFTREDYKLYLGRTRTEDPTKKQTSLLLPEDWYW